MNKMNIQFVSAEINNNRLHTLTTILPLEIDVHGVQWCVRSQGQHHLQLNNDCKYVLFQLYDKCGTFVFEVDW